MSKRNRDKRLGTQAEAPPGPKPRRLLWWLVVAGAAGVLLLASVAAPRLFEGGGSVAHGMHEMGDGPNVGALIPFHEQNVVTGAEISSRTLRGHRTLLFFSEGVMCQACFEQIRDIKQIGASLRRQDIRLVSITPDSRRALTAAIQDYDIDSPMISDDDRTMSAAFDTLGQGMHSDTPGHAFVLLDRRGRVVWQRDYWLAPYRTMYVAPSKLLDDLGEATS